MTARRPTRLARWHEWAIYLSFGALVLTGLAWLALDRWVRVTGEFGPEHHPAEHLLLIVHGALAYLLLVFAGALIPVHVKGGWRLGRNRWSGSILAAALGVLALTALGLYYVSGEAARGWSSVAHWVLGIAAVPVLAFHTLRGKSEAIPPRAASQPRRGRRKPAG
jgi:hypothetical protein